LLLSGALMPFDRRIARWSQRPRLQRSAAGGTAADVFNFAGDPGTVILGGATYAVGLLAHRRTTAEVGLHATGAVIAGSVVTGTAKALLGRARPYVTGDSNSTDVGFARGLRRGTAYQSLPSGHATAAFAFAGALAAEGAYRWPRVNRVTGPVGFTAATLVAAARVYRDRHWASDVALGAGIGAVTGAALIRYQHSHPDNTLDRRLLPRTTASPAAFSWTVHF
jgi:membrane-associated phospholipid phosphatase